MGAVACDSASAAPQDGAVRAGNAVITQSGVTTTIKQTTDRAVIDWRSFEIAAGETVNFTQPGAQSATLNRVTGGQLTSLEGTLTANGQVYLVNPNGILIGGGATINAASFVATTASIGNASFMADPAAVGGRYDFNQLTAGARSGTISNAGTITVAAGGLAALVAPAVSNTGTISAHLGRIELASANLFTLDLYGDDLVRLAVGDSVTSRLQDSSGNALSAQILAGGQLTADGGRIVLLTVPAAASIVDQAINLSGVVQARTASATSPGTIQLLANDGAVLVSGTLDASAPGAGLNGGSISIAGSTVEAGPTAIINASGSGDGGFVALGGSYTAGGITVTQHTTVDTGAVITACGTIACAADGTGGSGHGGEIRLYSDQGTSLSGTLNVSASADAEAGIVEVLSNNGLTELTATADIHAISGGNQPAGFAAIMGDTLSVSAGATIDMRDIFGNSPEGVNRLIYDGRDGAVTRSYVLDPNQDHRQTQASVVFHAYTQGGFSDYFQFVPAPYDPIANPDSHVFTSAPPNAPGIETPVGTLRPNGGAPTTFFATGADALTAVPVTFVPTQPAGSDVVGNQVSDAASRLTEDLNSLWTPAGEPVDSGPMLMSVGGPGVAALADLGRNGTTTGAAPDVFGINFQVLGPAGGSADAQVSDYLCKTPFAHNGCVRAARSK